MQAIQARPIRMNLLNHLHVAGAWLVVLLL